MKKGLQLGFPPMLRNKIFIFILILHICCCRYIEIQNVTNRKGKYESLLQFKQNLNGSTIYSKGSPNIGTVKFTFTAESEKQFDIKFEDAENPDRFSMPKIEPFGDLYNDAKPSDIDAGEKSELILKKASGEAFGFSIVRESNNDQIFSCDLSIIFSDVYLEYKSILPSEYIFGLGERNYENLRMKPGLYTLKARDQVSEIENGRSGNKGVYSSHPVYLAKEKNGNFHVVFYKNPTPTDVTITASSITFQSVGGIPHFKIFVGDTNPETAIKLYHKYLAGGHALPPFWVFGFHQSRWGYPTSQNLKDVIHGYHSNKIPLDTIWSDIDFMIQKQTFTVDSNAFPDSFFKELHEKLQINYVPIVDVAVGINKLNGQNHALKKGIEYDAFCRSPQSGRYFVGEVWPKASYFPDFFHVNATKYWGEMMEELYQKVNYTGMWLDMNEPANFINGESTQVQLSQLPDQSINKDYIRPEIELPFKPGKVPLVTNSLPPNLVHYGNYTHKDVHNLYGLMDTYITYKALKERLNKVYPFILTRSSFPGSGRHTFKWTGDNASRFEFLKLSIPGLINFNIFGIPFVGADICGFMENTNPELCTRWIQVGSLYPFSRNHNNDQPKSQELYALGEEVKNTGRINLRLRYGLLKHYFMLFVRTNHSGTVFRPLFFEYSSDAKCFEDQVMNTQFMLGKELMSTPILEEGINKVSAYFPEGIWYDFLSGYKAKEVKEGAKRDVINSLSDTVPLFISEGNLVGYQNTKNVLTQKDLTNEFKLICALVFNESTQLYECSGNLLNLENPLDEKEVQQECDKEINSASNCLIKITIQVSSTNRKLYFNAKMHDEGEWKGSSQKKLKRIGISSIQIYGFPSDIIENDAITTSRKEIPIVGSRYNYSYNYLFAFDPKKFLLSNVDELTISF